MVKPCKECENEFCPAKCRDCTALKVWFPQAWDSIRAWVLREIAWAEERRRLKARPAPDGRYSHREIVFGTVFTELWR